MKLRYILLLGSTLLTAGCAGVVTAWKNDPLQSYDIEAESIYAMTGDRRTAVMMKAKSDYRFCAESLPDAVAAFAASSKAKLAATGKAELDFSDATAAGLLQTFQRTEIAEVFRQLGWNTCLAWAQHAIDDDEYYGLLEKMVSGGIAVMTTRASQPPVAQTIPSASMVVSTETTPGPTTKTTTTSTPTPPTPPAATPTATPSPPPPPPG